MRILRSFLAIVFTTLLSSSIFAENPDTYRFPRECETTPDGYPVPLCGKPLTKTPVIKKTKDDLSVQSYPAFFQPGETLNQSEMRLTAIGSGNPAVRRGQAATCWLVELGNGDKFIFDIGGGAVAALWSLRLSPDTLDKLFITHLHFDHVGGIFTLWDAMGWGRNRPLNIWGGSGSTPDLGLESFIENLERAGAWHKKSKSGTVAADGMQLVAHEIDSSKFSPDSPRTLIYDKNGVKVYAFPVDHILIGAIGYRLEWNGLSMAFTGDSIPTTFEAAQAKGVDVFIHELFVDAHTMAKHGNMALEMAEQVIHEHTSPQKLGKIFDIAKPTLGVATHFYTNDYTIDTAFRGIATTYSGPVVIAQDLMVINVTQKQIVTRMAKTDLLAWGAAPLPPEDGKEPTFAPVPKVGRTPDWLSSTRLFEK